MKKDDKADSMISIKISDLRKLMKTVESLLGDKTCKYSKKEIKEDIKKAFKKEQEYALKIDSPDYKDASEELEKKEPYIEINLKKKK